MTETNRFELSDTGVLTLQNKKGDDDLIGDDAINPIRVTVYSPGSKQGVRALHKAGQAAQLRLQGLVRGKSEKNAAESADRELAQKLADVTAGIENFSSMGPPLDVYANPKLRYITSQVEQFFSDNGNF